MKEGFIQKGQEISENALIKINAFSRKNLTSDDVYTFTVVLCDNEVDRDFERFTTESLYTLANLFVGKTGIFDHSHKSSDQTARIYECYVEVSDDKLNSIGEKYACLKAKAYMLRLDKNKDLIEEIEAGIKKEVSVGCSVAKAICSVCGADCRTTPCEHRPGAEYDGKMCFTELSQPIDAYEWSFVAVPAQPQAGVTKRFERNVEDDVQKLHSYIAALEKEARFGKIYREKMIDDTVRLVSFTLPDANLDVIKKAASALDAQEIAIFKELLEDISCEKGLKSQFEEETDRKTEKISQQSFLI